MNLLLDLGNTRLKIALERDGVLHDVQALTHADSDFDTRLEHWMTRVGVAATAQAWLAAVAPDNTIARVEAGLRRHGVDVRRVLTAAEALGLRIAYADPRRLGVDRWLSLLAARNRGEGAWLVAGVGSAMTIDAVDAAGLHLGGLIAPPPEAMRVALLTRAPRLDVAQGQVQRFATSTEDAIVSGCVLGAAALIERSAQELAQRTGGSVRMLLGGGGAEPLRDWLPPHDYAPLLVLDGLALWIRHLGPQA